MKLRKKLKYPPFCNLSLIRISSADFDALEKEASKIKNYIVSHSSHIQLLGPSSPSMPKINNIYYLHIILKYQSTKEIYPILQFIVNQYKKKTKIQVDIDLSPARI